MFSVSRSTVISAPPERVYEEYVTFSSWLEWVPHFNELTPLDGGPLRPGYRARIRERVGVVARVWEVTKLEPGHSFAWSTTLVPGLDLTVDHRAEPDGAGTLATIGLHIGGLIAPLAAPLALPLTSRNFDRSLERLKARVEGDPRGAAT